MIFRKSEKSEDIIKRKSYYGFARYYPGKMGTKKYVIGESKVAEKKRKNKKNSRFFGFCCTLSFSIFYNYCLYRNI